MVSPAPAASMAAWMVGKSAVGTFSVSACAQTANSIRKEALAREDRGLGRAERRSKHPDKRVPNMVTILSNAGGAAGSSTTAGPACSRDFDASLHRYRQRIVNKRHGRKRLEFYGTYGCCALS